MNLNRASGGEAGQTSSSPPPVTWGRDPDPHGRLLAGGPSDMASDWPECSPAASDWSRWQLPLKSPTSSLFLVLPSPARGLTAWTLGVVVSEPS